MTLHRLVVLLAVALAPTLGAVQQPTPSVSPAPSVPSTPSRPDAAAQPERPRFRGGANLVRLDAYVTVEGAAVMDLTAQDFEVLENALPSVTISRATLPEKPQVLVLPGR